MTGKHTKGDHYQVNNFIFIEIWFNIVLVNVNRRVIHACIAAHKTEQTQGHCQLVYSSVQVNNNQLLKFFHEFVLYVQE